jgi:hypothetical protein
MSNSSVNISSSKLGFWSAVGCVVTFIFYTVCFVAILMNAPIFTWTNFQDYVAYTNAYNQTWKYIAQTDMLLFGILYIILLNSIYDQAQPNVKGMLRLGLIFGVLFALLSGAHYFVQITTVRLSIQKGYTDGLLQFIQAYPYSGLAAMNMLGWTLFLGLSSLFVAPAFAGDRLAKLLRFSFIANGLFCLIGGIGYVFEITLLVFFCTTLGMGAAVTTFSIALCFWFRRSAIPSRGIN